MPDKARAKKKPVKAPTRAVSAPKKSTKRAASTAPAVYLECAPFTMSLSNEKGKGKSGAREFASFADAKAAAIEALVDAIEDAEDQLTRLKQATSLDQLTARQR